MTDKTEGKLPEKKYRCKNCGFEGTCHGIEVSFGVVVNRWCFCCSHGGLVEIREATND